MAGAEPRPSAWGGLTAVLDTPAKRGIAIGVILVVMAVAPLVFGPYATVILTNALLYTILALGLNIVVGYAGLLDLGYAAFFAVGAYSVGILTTSFGWNFWATIPVAVLAAMVAGVVIGGPTLRLRSDYLAIVTLGFGEIVRIAGAQPQDHRRRERHHRHRAALAVRLAHRDGRSISTTCSWCSRSSASWSRCGSPIRASAAPGSMSGTTRTPPRRWASTGCG